MKHWSKHTFRRLYKWSQSSSSRDYFWLVDFNLILGGACFDSENTFVHLLSYFSKLLALFHGSVITTCLVESLYPTVNSVHALWFLLLLIFMSSGLMRERVLRETIHHIKVVKRFLNHSPIISNDFNQDSILRHKLKRNITLPCFIILTIMIFCEFSAPVLTFQRNIYYRIPESFQAIDPALDNVLQWVYIMTVFPLWVNKVFGPTILVTAMMCGLHTECRIMERGFENYVRRIVSTNRTGDRLRQYSNRKSWESLKKELHFHVDQHIYVIKKLKKLQHVVRYLYFVIHYFAMALVAISIYLTLMDEMPISRFIVALNAICCAMECYWWCTIADSFQSVNAAMEQHVAELMLSIPWRRLHHLDYVQLRTSLMIFKINIRNSARFNCAGISQLSPETFVQILQRSYAILTFLLNVGVSKNK